MRKYTFRYFSFQIRYRYQQVCFTRGKRKAVIFYKYLWHYDLPRFRLKSNNDEAEFARNFNGVNIKCCIQTKTFSYRFTKTCLSLSAVSNVQQEYFRYYNVMCKFELCAMQYLLYQCFLSVSCNLHECMDVVQDMKITQRHWWFQWPGTFHRELVQGTIREFILRSLEGWHVSKELVKGTCPRIR